MRLYRAYCILCNNCPYKLKYNCSNKSCIQNFHHLSRHCQVIYLNLYMKYYICQSKRSCRFLGMRQVPTKHLLYKHFHMRWYISLCKRCIRRPNPRRH